MPATSRGNIKPTMAAFGTANFPTTASIGYIPTVKLFKLRTPLSILSPCLQVAAAPPADDASYFVSYFASSYHTVFVYSICGNLCAHSSTAHVMLQASAAPPADDASFFVRQDGEAPLAYAQRVFDRLYAWDIERLLGVEEMWKSRAKPKPLRLAGARRCKCCAL